MLDKKLKSCRFCPIEYCEPNITIVFYGDLLSGIYLHLTFSFLSDVS